MAELVIKLADGGLAGQTGQTLVKNLKEAALAANKATIGTQEWVNAQNKLADAKGLVEANKAQIEATTKASNTLKQSFGGILNQIPGFSQISGAMRSATSGVGGLTSGFGSLKGAIIATGIGALVIAVTALVGWFSKTEKGANMISGAFKAMGAVVDTIMGKLWNIGNTLKELFSNPLQFFKNLSNDIVNAAKEGYDFVQVMDAIEDRQRDMEITAKENDILVDQMLLQAKNVGKTYQERLDILNKANDLTRKTYKDQLALSKEYLDAVEKEVQAELKRQGQSEMTDEQADRIKEAKLKYLDILGQEIQTEEKIANRKEQILGKQEKAEDKANADKEKSDAKIAAARQKQLDDEEKARLNILQLRASDQAKGEQQEIDAINAGTQAKIDALVGSEAQITEQRLLLEDIAQRQIQEVKDKYAKAAAKKEVDEAEQLNEQMLITQVNGLSERYLAGQLSQAQYLALNEKAVKDSEQRKLDIIKKAHGVESKEYQEQYKKILDQNVKFAEASGKQLAQAMAATASTLGGIFGELASMQEQGSEDAKSLLIAQAIMATITSSINAYESTAKIAYVGAILAPIAAGVALAAGYANVNKIKNTPVPKAKATKKELGGLLEGPRHSEGGIPLEAEGGEFIFSRKAVGAIGIGKLTRTNDYYTKGLSGKRFETGGPVNPFDSSRSPIPSDRFRNQSGEGDAIDYEKLGKVMADHTRNEIHKIKVQNVATETEGVLKTINTIKDEANA